MTFQPWDPANRKPKPQPDRTEEQKAMEFAGGEMAAHAIIQMFRGPRDWIRFEQEQGGPTAYAERAFPPGLFSDEARRGFIEFYLERMMKAGIHRIRLN
jgi:hypothetical protein